MIEQQLLERINRVTQRSGQLCFRRSLATGLALVAASGFALYFTAGANRWLFAVAVPVLCLGAMAAWLIARQRAMSIDADPLDVARQIEARYPSLDAKLITAVEKVQAAPPHGLGYLQQTVVQQAIDHSDQYNWPATVPSLDLQRWGLACTSASLALVGLLIVLILSAQPFTGPLDPPTHLISNPVATHTENTLTIEPGDVSIERGSSLIVTGRFSHTIPAGVSLILEGPSPTLGNAITTRTLPMSASLDDPLVGARVPNITTDLTYRIIAEGIESPSHRVTVFDYPQLVQADATLTYPDYTGLAVKQIEDTRQVTAIEGTQVAWSLKLNKAVTSAKLVAESGEEINLVAESGSQPVVQGSITLTKSQRYKLALIDEAGRKNKHEVEFVMSALKNRPPDLKLVFPRRDLRVSPIEETLVVAQAFDDFGIKEIGITYSMAGRTMTNVTLAKDVAGKTNQEVAHLLSFEAMKAQPDELLSYHFWADDVGPDGKVRRTFGDMYFAEVRPFEEIFREGEAPTNSEQQQQQQQQQQQNSQQRQIGEGIKQQREIINATWNLIRRETGEKPMAQFKDDAQAVREAQEAALEGITKVKEQLEDPQSLAHVEVVEKHMAEAASHLAQAAETNDPSLLKLALPAEQQAYQALLKLQAREHEVVRSQQQQQQGQQSGQQQAGPSQQQLNELELRNQDNRYETQRQAQEAQPQEDAAQRETRQALNRLRDLAKRQQDLNEKLKELDLALQEAKTQQEKEELARQLKRLREQQEEMLRDVDELRNRMEQNQQQQAQQQQQQQQQNQNQQTQNQKQDGKQNEKQNANANDKENKSPQTLRERTEQQQANDAKQQVDEVRQNIREATEALEKGMTSKALTEGTRAERKLEELREEFRKRASGQFADDVKEMRDDARKLAGDQEKLGEKMKQIDKAGPRSLRDTGERKQVVDALDKQKEKLGDLTDRMRRVTEEAETSEPLLSKQLYDTLRNADQSKVDQALDVTRELFEKGFKDEAETVEPQARKGLNDLKRGVEKAADSVLGDEGEALRRARETLDDLAKQVEREGPAGENQREQLADANRPPREGQDPNASPGQKQGTQPGDKQSGKQGDPQGEKQGEQPGQNGKQSGDKQGQPPGDQQGDKQGKQPGDEQGKGNSDKQGQQPGQGKQAGDKQGQQPGQEQGQPSGERGQGGEKQGEQPGQQSGQQPGQPGETQGQPGDKQGESNQPGNGKGKGQPSRTVQAPTKGNPSLLDQLQAGAQNGGGSGAHGPITGENFREWSDRLRDVEEMVDDPNLREEVARVRDRAQAMRAEFKRHGKEPQWDDVKKLIADPLHNLRDRLDDELARRDQKRDLVPIDRDPVPGQFTDLVKQYYEKLGAGAPDVAAPR